MTGWRGMSALVQLLPYLENQTVTVQIDFDSRIWDTKNLQYVWTNPMPIVLLPE